MAEMRSREEWVIRLVAALLVAGLCSLLLPFIFDNFILRSVTDPRFIVSREALEAASRRLPDSPRINLRLAELSLSQAATSEQELSEGMRHAERAASFALWDFRTHALLGNFRELSGNPAGAEEALRTSTRLAPGSAIPAWQYGNLLLRLGRVAEAATQLRRAAEMSEDLYPAVCELLWRFSGGDAKLLAQFATGSPSAQLAAADFLVGQSRAEDAVALFRATDRRHLIADSRATASFITRLLDSGKVTLARDLWSATLTGEPGQSPGRSPREAPGGGLVWNGGFESDPEAILNHFDWHLSASPYAEIAIDSSTARSGRRSLRITFAGRDTTRLENEVDQLLAVAGGTACRLEFHATTRDFVTPEGPVVAVLSGRTIVASSVPIRPTDAAEPGRWQQYSFDFTAPASGPPLRLAIVRRPRFSYDDPTSGTVWYDDFRLEPLGEASRQLSRRQVPLHADGQNRQPGPQRRRTEKISRYANRPAHS